MKANMRISTEIDSASRIVGEERTIELLAKAGFDAWDFSMFSMCRFDKVNRLLLENNHPLAGNECLKFARRLKQIGLDNGVVCNQSHAPFPASFPEIRTYFKRAIECTAEAGGEICIIHPDVSQGVEENAEIYRELIPFAKECGAKIATENMWKWDKENDCSMFASCATPDSFCEHVDRVGSEWMVACLDIGHAEMRGSDTTATEMIRKLGSRLQALHIHDNDKWHDSHQMPFSMDIDFGPIAEALKEIDYRGYYTLEACNFLKEDTEENLLNGMIQLADSVRRFAEMCHRD